jgi:hypothetical protein
VSHIFTIDFTDTFHLASTWVGEIRIIPTLTRVGEIRIIRSPLGWG